MSRRNGSLMVKYAGEAKYDRGYCLSLQKPKMISGSRLNELPMGDVNFQYEITLQIFATAAYEFAEAVTARFTETNVKILPIGHMTFSDGSESDAWVRYASEGGEHVLVEIYHQWIDLYFLSFCLNLPDHGEMEKYLVDALFPEELMNEHTKDGERGGEMFVAPCTIRIRTVKEDPRNFLPAEDALKKLAQETIRSPWIRFWQYFSKNKFEQAAACVRTIQKLSHEQDSNYFFLCAVEALCQHRAGRFNKAVELFVQAAVGFHATGFDRNCDACLFFAIETAKKIDDLNLSTSTLSQIAQVIPDLSPSQHKEITDILKAYAVGVCVGVVVLCRRVLEISVKQILLTRFGKTIKDLVYECRRAGELEDKARGFFAVLIIAKWKEILTSQEFNIACGIKDYGNLVHNKDGLEGDAEAKYAIQASIHLLRRLSRFGALV